MCKGLGEPLGVCEEGEYIILSADMCSRAYTSYAVAAASSLVQHTQHLLANSSTLQVHPTVLWACGVVVLNRTLLEIAAATPQSRRTIVYIVDDYEFALHQDSARLYIVRTSMRRSLRAQGETVLPYVFEPLPKVLPPMHRAATLLPVVGFCGRNNSHRAPLLRELAGHSGIAARFYVQNAKRWTKRMTASTRTTAVNEFQTSIAESHFTVSTRGAGNFAMRFWQVLSAGRIPIMADSDIVLPLEGSIDWPACVVLEPSAAAVAARVLAIWAAGKAVEERQRRCADIHERFFSTMPRYISALLASMDTDEARHVQRAASPSTCGAAAGPTTFMNANGQLQDDDVGISKQSTVASSQGLSRDKAASAQRPRAQVQAAPDRWSHEEEAAHASSTRNCTCFALCTLDGVHSFLAEIPATIYTQDSPWYAYLTAVYLTPPQLPFSLAALRFFYANDPLHWPADVENPLLPCVNTDHHRLVRRTSKGKTSGDGSTTMSNKSSSSALLPPAETSRSCPPMHCERWTWRSKSGVKAAPSSQPHSTVSAAHAIGRKQVRGAVWFSNRAGRSRGTLLLLRSEPINTTANDMRPSTPFSRQYTWPLSSMHGRPGSTEADGTVTRRRFWPSGSFVEVIRVNQPRVYAEGVNGCMHTR